MQACVARTGGACRLASHPRFVLRRRLSSQKGIDLLLASLPDWIDAGVQVVVQGSGEAALEVALQQAAVRYPGRFSAFVGYDEGRAHRILAGSDALLMPSRFEPCGLTQLYGLRYGALPLVRRTGGLEDTVIDATPAALADGCATGIQFGAPTATEFHWALRRMFELYHDRERWQDVRRTAMTRDFGWTRSGRAYQALYRDLRPAAG